MFYITMKFFYNNQGIRALIIYFDCILIDLINDYKKKFILVIIMFVWWFLWELILLKDYCWYEMGYEGIFRFVGMLFLMWL